MSQQVRAQVQLTGLRAERRAGGSVRLGEHCLIRLDLLVLISR